MENKTNKIVTLANNKSYLILKHVIYDNETYYITSEIHEEVNFSPRLILLKETKENDKTYLELVKDTDTSVEILDSIK